MPTSDLQIELTVSKHVAQGQPSRGLTVTFNLTADGAPGLVLTAGQKTKLGATLEQLGAVIDGDKTTL